MRPERLGPLGRRVLFWGLLLLGAMSFIYPFLFMLSTAFKSPREQFRLNLVPTEPTLANFRAVFEQIPISQALLNSVLVYGTITLSVLIFSSIVGYALARLEFRGREFLFNIILLTMMIPGQLLLIPLYLLIVWLGWTDNRLGLIVPGMMSAFGIFMFRQTFKTIPQDLIDAARIDGANELTIIFRILVPVSMPTVITVGIFTFMGGWNDFLWPAIVIREQHLMTLTQMVTLYAIGGQAGGQFGAVMASSLIAVIPMVLVYVVFQKYYLQGLVSSGIKG
ncbi:carbohydrate ABC transporter permease [Allomeiothermus silvanus]|uniref:carbohydrate ABC transporter permease n=1 Tax=Allomeiothermus silvanus TaxID=52022 RepID=UPI0023F34AD7|nr:carbohydrate ABC transporter permease [Allomeiothermus silvanus]